MNKHDKDKIDICRREWEERAAKSDWIDAHGYIFEEGISPKQVYNHIVKDVIGKLELSEKDEVLEVGCATGRLSFEINKIAAKVVGVDFSETMIKRARQEYKDTGMVFEVAEAADLPFPDASFDKVLVYSVFHNFPSYGYGAKALSELLRVCRPGGIILIGDLCMVHETWKHDVSHLSPIRRTRARLGIIPWLRTPYDKIKYGLLGRSRKGTAWVYYSKRYFARRLNRFGCEFEFLDQTIPNKEWHRIDLKIWR